ncbi:ThiF family adenylyltransferase [Paenibacillus sp. IB182496]|uniref:ThiF family adenylyltransferase n=2 Tax=Paenibacillus sabuli TaxID=2772509 RepID=A0A927BWE4_9BACL|nr:ThiF family adenylyltransferase [Paenibacillus sabuli]
MDDRYSRQRLFAPIGEVGQLRIRQARVLIVGMGALGTVLANHMVRSGIGTVRMVDRDYVEPSNLQRQMLYDEADAAACQPKVVAARDKLGAVNSEVALEAHIADVGPHNVGELLQGMDLVLDGTDNFQTRLLLSDACFRCGIPFIYGGAVRAHGMTAIFIPGRTCCYRCLVGAQEGGGPTCDTVGVISPIIDIIASFQAVEALKYIVAGHGAVREKLLTLDVWHDQRFDMKLPPAREDCPVCARHAYPALEEAEPGAVTLCGRDSVQIAGRRPLDLAAWAERLASIGDVQRNPYLLRVSLGQDERLVLFPDGRVLVQGTTDLGRAQALYDRYIGS